MKGSKGVKPCIQNCSACPTHTVSIYLPSTLPVPLRTLPLKVTTTCEFRTVRKQRRRKEGAADTTRECGVVPVWCIAMDN